MAKSSPIQDLIGILGLLTFLLIFMSLWYVRPYLKTKHFKEIDCTVIRYDASINWNPKCECVDDLRIVCEKGNYTCLKITVSYIDSQSRNRTAFLYENDKTFAQNDKTCSYLLCETLDAKGYKDDYIEFRDTYTSVGKTFKCFYDEETNEAVVERNVSRAQAIGSTVGSVAGGIVLLALYAYCYFRKR